MRTPVKLSKVAEGFDMISDDCVVFLNLETGEAWPESEDAGFEPGDDEYVDIEARYEDPNYLALPTELHDWQIMSDFVSTVENQNARGQLDNAIRGRGAFRMFRSTVERLDLLDAWYAFHAQALRALAMKFLKENDVPFVDDTQSSA